MIGFLIDIGSRDETEETSGCLAAFKACFLKTFKNSDENLNFGVIQMSGGDLGMDFDNEKTYIKGHCLEHDVEDMLSIMIDSALEPKTEASVSIARSKTYKNHTFY